MQIQWRSIGMNLSVREQRCVLFKSKDSEGILDRLASPTAAGPLTAENNARMLAEKMADRLSKIGVTTKINYWFSGKRAADARVDSFLDAAAQKEIERLTDATVSWLGSFVKRKKFRRYVALKHAVKERLREEVQTYVSSRRERLSKLEFAASVSARLKGMKNFLPLDKSAEQKLEDALQRVRGTMEKRRQADAAKGRVMPSEWMEASEAEATLKKQLIRFNVIPPEEIETYVKRNADGKSNLVHAIKRCTFVDPDAPGGSSHLYEKKLCLRLASTLQTGWLKKPYKGYRSYLLTQPVGNELPFEKRLQHLANGDPIAKRVQCVVDGVGKVDGTVVARDNEFPNALIVQGPGGTKYVLDTETGRLSFKNRFGYRHVQLKEQTFSILS